jgi:hypothetical protein
VYVLQRAYPAGIFLLLTGTNRLLRCRAIHLKIRLATVAHSWDKCFWQNIYRILSQVLEFWDNVAAHANTLPYHFLCFLQRVRLANEAQLNGEESWRTNLAVNDEREVELLAIFVNDQLLGRLYLTVFNEYAQMDEAERQGRLQKSTLLKDLWHDLQEQRYTKVADISIGSIHAAFVEGTIVYDSIIRPFLEEHELWPNWQGRKTPMQTYIESGTESICALTKTILLQLEDVVSDLLLEGLSVAIHTEHSQLPAGAGTEEWAIGEGLGSQGEGEDPDDGEEEEEEEEAQGGTRQTSVEISRVTKKWAQRKEYFIAGAAMRKSLQHIVPWPKEPHIKGTGNLVIKVCICV